MQSSDCLREDTGSADLICGQFCFCNSIPIKAIPAPIPNPYLRQFDSDDDNQGWGRLQKPDYDYSAHKTIDYDYSGD